jgi:hypothetical protein
LPTSRALGLPNVREAAESIEDNLRDLQRHADDFANRRGFTYTMLEPGSGDVVGCVYIYPDDAARRRASVTSWVRATRAELDVPLWRTVSAWPAADWPFDSVGCDARDAEPDAGS